MVALIKLSYEIASGAQVSFDFNSAVNQSEGDIAGRISFRPVKREYMLSVNPAQSAQIVHAVMALRGDRYAFAIRDYADNYKLEDEVLEHSGTVAFLGRTWKPSTFVNTSDGSEVSGSMSFFERILIPDTKERPFVIKVNDVETAYTLSDFGLANIAGLTTPDVVKATGDYLSVVTYVDAPSTTIITNSNGQTLHRFSDMRLRQIFESELIDLTS